MLVNYSFIFKDTEILYKYLLFRRPFVPALRKRIFHFPAQIREKRLCARLCVRLCAAVVLCAAIVLRAAIVLHAVTCPQSSFERPPLHMPRPDTSHSLHLPLLKHTKYICHTSAKHATQVLLYKWSWRSMCVLKCTQFKKKTHIPLFFLFVINSRRNQRYKLAELSYHDVT